jgi:protein involved in polysaccharide export with SLBB domain
VRYILNIILAISFVLAQDAAEIKKQIEASGLSESQIRQMAKQRGMSDADIDAKAQEIKGETAAGEAAQPIIEDIPDAGGQDVSIELPESTVEETLQDGEQPQESIESVIEDVVEGDELDVVEGDELDIVEDELILESQGQPGRQAVDYYGYNIFQRDPAVFQSSVAGAVDPNYNIGPGDEIIFMLWGETQFRQVLNVDREGFIFIPEVGQVFVNGLTMDLLESKLFKVLSQRYSSLIRSNDGNATTFLDISLGNMRPLRVIVLGEVAQPGAYQVSPSTTLFSALYYFNGPTTLGSLRDIRLIRGGKQIATIDFYDYLLSGKKINDVRLQLDDTIFLPTRGKSVSISGEINRPAIYELEKGEGLQDLMRMAGGLRVSAYLDRAQIDRIVPPEERDALGMDRMFIDVDLKQIMASKKGFALKDGDNIQIFSILDLRQNIVEINGAVVRPGRFDIGESLQLRDLVLKADSLVGDAYLDRVNVVRFNPDFTEKLLKLNLGLAMKGDPQHNIQLEPMDRVTVFSTSAMIPRRFVAISGHVKTPGRYLLREDLTLYDLIFKAGGFTDEEWLKTTYRQRAELVRVMEDSVTKEIIPFDLDEVLNKEGLAETLLRTDDAVKIYSLADIEGAWWEKFVSISGHVKRPGSYELFEENMTLYDLIFKAGGFDDEEYHKQTYLKRAELVRVMEDGVTKEIIPFNLDEVLNKGGLAETLLRTDDAVKIYSLTDIEGAWWEKFVSISGHVKRPGSYELFEENMTLYDLVFMAGGFDDEEYHKQTYLKRAELVRVMEDGVTKEIILFNLEELLNKEGLAETLLQTDDAVKIYSLADIEGAPEKFVSISGHVKRPGSYELFEENMTLYDLVFMAGGFDDEVWKNQTFLGRADLLRHDEDRITRSIIPFNLGEILENAESTHNLQLQIGDEIRVYAQTIFNAEKTVSIGGVVNNPGQYTLKTGMTIKDLILEAGGISQSVFKYKIEIARIDPNKVSEDIFAETISLEMDDKFSISNVKYTRSSNPGTISVSRDGFKLMAFDYITVRPDQFFSMQKIITINGAIYYPGDYTILSPNETIASIVERAGGLRHNAYPEASLLVREGQNINLSIKKAIQQPRSKHNFKVLTGDIITINVYPNVVAVFGEVNNPGMFKYTAGMSMRDCISQAGGYTTDADRSDVWIRYPSGDGKEFKRYALFSPKVMDGSVITVARDESEEVDKTEVTKEIASILADFVQIALTLTLIANM